jgi:hypothetical protein
LVIPRRRKNVAGRVDGFLQPIQPIVRDHVPSFLRRPHRFGSLTRRAALASSISSTISISISLSASSLCGNRRIPSRIRWRKYFRAASASLGAPAQRAFPRINCSVKRSSQSAMNARHPGRRQRQERVGAHPASLQNNVFYRRFIHKLFSRWALPRRTMSASLSRGLPLILALEPRRCVVPPDSFENGFQPWCRARLLAVAISERVIKTQRRLRRIPTRLLFAYCSAFARLVRYSGNTLPARPRAAEASLIAG